MRIALETSGTSASCFVADRSTGCLPSAGGIARPTHRPAFFISARVTVQAVVVSLTNDLDAGHVGIALVAIFASTDRFVLDDSAEGVITAGAGVIAELVDAGIRLITLIVSAAARQDGIQGPTAVVVRADVAVRTGADHGTHWE